MKSNREPQQTNQLIQLIRLITDRKGIMKPKLSFLFVFIISLTGVCPGGLLSCANRKPLNNDQSSQEYNKESSFFPIAVWLQEPQDAMAYKNHGINMYVGIWDGLTQTKLDLLKAADMKVIADLNEFAKENLQEPLIYGWMHGDEPDNAQWNPVTNSYDPCIDPSKIINYYNELKLADPSRPVYLNLGRGIAATHWVGRGECTGRTDMYKMANDGYLKGCDIASFDIYPVNSSEKEVRDSLWYIAKGVDSLREWSGYSKPTWCWIETTQINQGERRPTPEEVKSQVWMALIHGVSGIGYFCHSFAEGTEAAALLHDKEMILEVGKINEQITALAPVLNSPTIQDYVSVGSSNPRVPIDYITKKTDNTFYIFAMSMRPGDTSASFSIQKGKRVEVIGEDRTIDIEKGEKFIDQFSAYSVHLYKIMN